MPNIERSDYEDMIRAGVIMSNILYNMNQLDEPPSKTQWEFMRASARPAITQWDDTLRYIRKKMAEKELKKKLTK